MEPYLCFDPFGLNVLRKILFLSHSIHFWIKVTAFLFQYLREHAPNADLWWLVTEQS